jgi:hypothetical protein
MTATDKLAWNQYNLAAEWWRVIVQDMFWHPLSWLATLRRPPSVN